MAKLPPPLYLDEDVSAVVGAILVARGYAAVTVRDTKQLGRSDSVQLAHAAGTLRVLVTHITHNRDDLERLHREWLEVGKSHAGIIISRRRSPGEIAARVGRLLSRLGGEELRNQLFYV
ncbi:MAG: hypothetical protein EWM72_02821 [Nitrospira sp.]|nr:MAG: hypothetical protein EWM72_02821 [Nitrospira sp.]